MIYLIMCIIDESFENEKNSPELLLALHASLDCLVLLQLLICNRNSTFSLNKVMYNAWLILSLQTVPGIGRSGFLRNPKEGAHAVPSDYYCAYADKIPTELHTSGFLLVVSCVSSPGMSSIRRRAIEIFSSLALNLSGRLPRRLPGNQNVKQLARSK